MIWPLSVSDRAEHRNPSRRTSLRLSRCFAQNLIECGEELRLVTAYVERASLNQRLEYCLLQTRGRRDPEIRQRSERSVLPAVRSNRSPSVRRFWSRPTEAMRRFTVTCIPTRLHRGVNLDAEIPRLC